MKRWCCVQALVAIAGTLLTAFPEVPPVRATEGADYPAEGKTLSIIVPFPAGGGNDLAARLMAPELERELGIPVQVLNKSGASGQVGATEVARANPDGYTIGYPTVSAVVLSYLDPQRQAAFDRASFEPVANHVIVPITVAVQADSPYQTLKDFIDAGKANPQQLRVAVTRLTQEHLAVVHLEQMTDARFAVVGFEGGALSVAGLLGGHVDAVAGIVTLFLPHVKNGAVRVLGTMDEERSNFLPEVPTFEEQGYDLHSVSARAYLAPASTPKEIVNKLSEAIMRVVARNDHQEKLAEIGFTARYMSPEELGAFWKASEEEYRGLLEAAK